MGKNRLVVLCSLTFGLLSAQASVLADDSARAKALPSLTSEQRRKVEGILQSQRLRTLTGQPGRPQAQMPVQGPARTHMILGTVRQLTGLTDKQKKQLDTILVARAQQAYPLRMQLQKIMQDPRQDIGSKQRHFAAFNDKVAKLDTACIAQTRAVLTPEQAKELDLRLKTDSTGGGFAGPGGGFAGPAGGFAGPGGGFAGPGGGFAGPAGGFAGPGGGFVGPAGGFAGPGGGFAGPGGGFAGPGGGFAGPAGGFGGPGAGFPGPGGGFSRNDAKSASGTK